MLRNSWLENKQTPCLFPSTLRLITAPSCQQKPITQNQIHPSSSNRHWQAQCILRLFVRLWLIHTGCSRDKATPQSPRCLWVPSCRQTGRNGWEWQDKEWEKQFKIQRKKKHTPKIYVYVFSTYSNYLNLSTISISFHLSWTIFIKLWKSICGIYPNKCDTFRGRKNNTNLNFRAHNPLNLYIIISNYLISFPMSVFIMN